METAAGESGKGSGSLRFAGGSAWTGTAVGGGGGGEEDGEEDTEVVVRLLLLFAAPLLPPPAPPVIAGEWMAAAAAMADIASPTTKVRQNFHRKFQCFFPQVSLFSLARLIDGCFLATPRPKPIWEETGFGSAECFRVFPTV